MSAAPAWLRKNKRGIQIAFSVVLLVVFCVFLWINAQNHGPASSANKEKGQEAEQRTLPDATISTPPGQAGSTQPGSASTAPSSTAPAPAPAPTPTDANTGATPVK